MACNAGHNGGPGGSSFRGGGGSMLVMIAGTPVSKCLPTDPPSILWQDERFLALHKPVDWVVHNSDLEKEANSLVQWLRDQDMQAAPVHRLDRPTSGVVLFARSGDAARLAQAEMQAGNLHRHYVAIVRGTVVPMTMINPLRQLHSEPRRGLRPSGPPQNARTTVEVAVPFALENGPDTRFPATRYSYVEILLHTGRTHQIRRHMQSWSHPIIGDVTYGKGIHNRFFRTQFNLHRLMLHAHAISGPTFLPAIVDPLPQEFGYFPSRQESW